MKNDPILKALNWRYATKTFDNAKKIDSETLQILTESLRLAPSSVGIQPWKFLVVESQEIKKILKENGYGQSQLFDASHVVVLCRKNNIDAKHIDTHIQNTAKGRGVEAEMLAGYRKMIEGTLSGFSQDEYEVWASNQVHIALGFLLVTASCMHIDACPMEGFDKSVVDVALGLKDKGLSSVVICALGYRGESDQTARYPRARFASSEVIEFL